MCRLCHAGSFAGRGAVVGSGNRPMGQNPSMQIFSTTRADRSSAGFLGAMLAMGPALVDRSCTFVSSVMII